MILILLHKVRNADSRLGNLQAKSTATVIKCDVAWSQPHVTSKLEQTENPQNAVVKHPQALLTFETLLGDIIGPRKVATTFVKDIPSPMSACTIVTVSPDDRM